MIEWERIEPWVYIIDTVTTEYHRKFNMVEADDIRQCLYQWFVEHPNKLTEWESIGARDAKNLLYRSLRNQALDYCQRWKAKTVGYAVDDVFYYESDMVEALLPSVLRGEAPTGMKVDLGRVGRPSAPNEGGNMMAMMIEIDYAYWKLNKEDRKVLFLRFAEAMEYAAIAEEFEGKTEDAMRMQVNRTVRKLINKIGGFKPYVDEDSHAVEQESVEV